MLGLMLGYWWILPALFVVTYFAASRGKWSLLPIAVLQEWVEGPPNSATLVAIRGRRAGLMAFVLEAVGLDSSVRFILRANEIEIAYTSLSGHLYFRIPIAKVAFSVTGFTRPIHWLVLGLPVGVLSALALDDGARSGVVGILIAAGLIAAFVFGKSSVLAIDAGQVLHGMRFKGSVIHGRVVDLAAAQRVARLIGDLTARHSPGAAGTAEPFPEPLQHAPPLAPLPTAHCGGCGRVGLVGQRCVSCDSLID